MAFLADTGHTYFSGTVLLADIEQAEFSGLFCGQESVTAIVRGGRNGRQGRNIKDFNNSLFGYETGSGQGNETGIRLSSCSSKIIKGANLHLTLTSLGLHSIPSYSTSVPSGTDDVAGSCSCSEVLLGSASGTIVCTDCGSGIKIMAGSGSMSVVDSGFLSTGLVAVDVAVAVCTADALDDSSLADGKGGTIV